MKKYEAGSMENLLEGYKGNVKKLELRLQHQKKALEFMEDKILKYRGQIANQSRLYRALAEADPKLYYKLLQQCFEDINKEKIPEEYRT